MEEIYSEDQRINRITKAKSETVKFLLGFSASMQIIECQNMQFEVTLN